MFGCSVSNPEKVREDSGGNILCLFVVLIFLLKANPYLFGSNFGTYKVV